MRRLPSACASANAAWCVPVQCGWLPSARASANAAWCVPVQCRCWHCPLQPAGRPAAATAKVKRARHMAPSAPLLDPPPRSPLHRLRLTSWPPMLSGSQTPASPLTRRAPSSTYQAWSCGGGRLHKRPGAGHARVVMGPGRHPSACRHARGFKSSYPASRGCRVAAGGPGLAATHALARGSRSAATPGPLHPPAALYQQAHIKQHTHLPPPHSSHTCIPCHHPLRAAVSKDEGGTRRPGAGAGAPPRERRGTSLPALRMCRQARLDVR